MNKQNNSDLKKSGNTYFDCNNKFITFSEQLVINNHKIKYDINLRCDVDQIDHVCLLLQELKKEYKNE